MSDIPRLPPERMASRGLRIAFLYLFTIGIQAAALFACPQLFPKDPRMGFIALGGFMALADVVLLLMGLSLRKSYLGSRDTVARYGATQIASLLGILRVESEMLEFLGRMISVRVVEREQVEANAQFMEDIKEIEALIGGVTSSLGGGKGRQEAFFHAMAEATERFAVLFPRLQEAEKRMVSLVLDVLDEFRESRISMFRYMFFLSETGTILSRMSSESNRYSSGKMESILKGFKELASHSASIGQDASAIMRDIMDAEGRTSLGGVARESGRISSDLESFFGELDSLRGFAGEIVSANAKQLANIRKMAEGIEGFSETIRLISMNVNIEAARLSSSSGGAEARNSGKGFQVLARNMNDFALKAQELAQNERLTIGEAEDALKAVNDRFAKRVDDLVARIPEIRARLEPFESVIKSSFERLEGAVRTLGGLSGAVDQRLKAIIGQLQFQDLTRQEVEHIVKFLSTGLSLDSEFGAKAFALQRLTEPEEIELRRKAVEIYRELATTINEHRVIEAYSSEKGIVLDEEDGQGRKGSSRDEELSDGSIRMF